MGGEPTRRLVLAASAASTLALAGCKGIAALGPAPKPGADVVALQHAIAAEELMVARYEAALPRLTGSARHAAAAAGIKAEHEAHLAQLRSRLILPPRLATASPRPSPAAPAPPAGQHATLTELASAEVAASRRLLGQLPGAPPALAQLMASIGAAEAAHVVLLGRGRDAPGSSVPPSAPPPGTIQAGPEVAALQAALAAEQAASYGYGIVGSHLGGSRYAAAAADCVAHERARDTVAGLITALRARPRPAAAVYRLPVTVVTGKQAVGLAILLERQVTAAYLGVVALADQPLRAFAAESMRACAVRAVRWGARSQPFPGLPSSSLRPR